MNLWDLKPKQSGSIVQIEKSCTYSDRLTSYGFTIGQKATLLYKTAFSGPKVYLIGESIYSLSKELAYQIRIETDNK